MFVSLPLWHYVLQTVRSIKFSKYIQTFKIIFLKMTQKWTITHQMCMHYNLIGGTSNPINKVQMEMRKEWCQWKLGLAFLEPLGLN